jgi:hypothetical protein
MDDEARVLDSVGLGEGGQRVTVWKNLLAWTVIFEVTAGENLHAGQGHGSTDGPVASRRKKP